MPRRALIFGILGQDGSYLTEHLSELGYEVHGVTRGGNAPAHERWLGSHGVLPQLTIHTGDVTVAVQAEQIILETEPDEIYHLAGMSSVAESFANPALALDAIARSSLNVLEAARRLASRRDVRCFMAGSAEIFDGEPSSAPQNESTPARPRNPYGCAKAYAMWQTATHRRACALFACTGILFNHESPRRPERFVSKKIAQAAARIRLGLEDKVVLGNLDASRDWGFAKEYVEAMRLMLTQDEPSDYVVATGETHSVRDFVEHAFDHVGLDWREHVEIDSALLRPSDGAVYCGDATKARERLGWRPRTSFRQLVELMVDHELAVLEHAAEDVGR